MQSAGTIIDDAYSNPIVSFGVAFAVSALVVFSDVVALCHSTKIFIAACFVFLGTLTIYEENNVIAFMASAFVISLVSPSQCLL